MDYVTLVFDGKSIKNLIAEGASISAIDSLTSRHTDVNARISPINDEVIDGGEYKNKVVLKDLEEEFLDTLCENLMYGNDYIPEDDEVDDFSIGYSNLIENIRIMSSHYDYALIDNLELLSVGELDYLQINFIEGSAWRLK